MTSEKRPDILVTAREGKPILAVEVKRREFDRAARQQITEYSRSAGADFVMGIDPHYVIVAPTRNGSPIWEQAITLSTVSVLRKYSDLPTLDHIEDFYLEGLIEAWLQDFAFAWKSERPPGYDELDRIGLASRLRNSETHAE